MVYPTVDLPPSCFGTYEHQQCDTLVSRENLPLARREGKVFMTYLTRVGPEEGKFGAPGIEAVQLDVSNPFI
jgi:hypothetical protein